MRRLYDMKRILPFFVYAVCLLIEIARVIILVYSKISFFTIADFMGIALLCLPAILWFMLLQNENDFHKVLKINALIKFFCILAAYFFLIKAARNIDFNLRDAAIIKFQYVFTWTFIPVDTIMLIFSLARERYLCK